MPTNFKPVVDRVNREHPQLLRANTPASCGEFIQRVANEPECKAERVGLLSKSANENGYTFPNNKRCALDVIAWPNGERVDIIQSAGGSPAPGGPTWQVIPPDQWRPSNVWVDIDGWPIYDSGAGDIPAPADMVVAYGWFCWMTAHAEFSEAPANERWIMSQIRPQVFRTMLCVEGRSHGNPDPWRDAAVLITPGVWEGRFQRMLDRFLELGVQGHLTVYGGRNQTPSHDDRRRFHDRIVAAVGDRWKAIRSWEMMNEFKVNKWEASEVRAAGQDLASKLPRPYKLALSSPNLAHGYVDGRPPTNEEMADSFDELYANQNYANEITVHTMRDGGKWSDPSAFNIFYPTVPKINNEPPGPGASAGGEQTTANDVKLDMERTQAAGWAMYVGHSEWVPWNGHLPREYWNGWREIKDVSALPNNPECAAVMASFSDGTTPPTVKNKLMPGEKLGPEEQLVVTGFQCKYQIDGNLVTYTKLGEPVWHANVFAQPGNLQMNPDGNLVAYDATGQPYWSTQTDGHPGAMVQLQEDGNLVVYKDGVPLWGSF